MLDPVLKSATKDFYGPIHSLDTSGAKVAAYAFKYQDSFSVLGWGKMPDVLEHQGLINSKMHHYLATQLKSETAWKEFLRSADALTFRKAAASIPFHTDQALSGPKQESIGSMLNEMSEQFPIPHFYLGMLSENEFKDLTPNQTIQIKLEQNENSQYGVVQAIQEEKVPVSTVLGRAVRDYGIWKSGLLPFEFNCHFELRNETIQPLVIPKAGTAAALKVGTSWDFPLMEVTLAQDPFQQKVGMSELLWITRLSPSQIQKILLSAAWVSSFLRYTLQKKKITLLEASLRFAMDENGRLMIASFQTPDELKLEKDQVILNTNLTLEHYQKTSWYEGVLHAQKVASQQGLADWKRLCVEAAPWLEKVFKSEVEKKLGELQQCFSESKPA